MNYNDNKELDNVTPYKATGNLNTAISNPSVNINNTMDVNIKSVNTIQNNVPNTNNNISVPNNQNTINLNQNNINTIPLENNINKSNIKKTYVTTDNKPKKKKLNLNLTKEFKIALLIIVILFVFVLILDLLPSLF